MTRSYELETGVRWMNPGLALGTRSNWGLNWYIDHTSSASVDGLYGLVYVAPSPSRPRPYHLITNDTLELRQIKEAERTIQHAAIQNHQHRDTVWKLLRMKAEGSEYYCYDSILARGVCTAVNPALSSLMVKPLMVKGAYSQLVYRMRIVRQLVRTTSHKMTVVANNGGFVVPEQTDVVYIPSAARITVLVKLDAEPGDYAIRISSTSQLQTFRAKRLPRYGEPMTLPTPASPKDVCLLADASTEPHCKTIDGQSIAPYPPKPPPASDHKHPEHVDFTFRLSAGSQPSLTEPKVPEFYLNEKPWQLFHGSMTPLLFHRLDSNEKLDKPIISQLPIGSVVDLIIENQINDTIPLYKHGDPAWLLGSSSGQSFPGRSVKDAVSSPSSPQTSLNLHNPALVTVHDLPPLGWSVLRFQVTSQAASMLHSAKLRYFLLGMTVPILEGITAKTPIEIPEEAFDRPHVEFEPKNDGIFG
ncbi:hypothetical protein CEP54_012376 [Fusarium duplospermum]|uniref:Laccase n=1 Tax=Fusarium duplospermum TaxID=1325734 RepID=A0A428P973_9HYPO|nr:hypothetical protein CEP54_012376 [Fusarium duplospermum]